MNEAVVYYCRECGQELPEGAPRRHRERPGASADAVWRRRIFGGVILGLLAAGIVAAIVVLGNADTTNTVSTPQVTIAPSARATLQAAGAAFSQRLISTKEDASEEPLDPTARRASAQEDLEACQRFQTRIGDVTVPRGMQANMTELTAATTDFCNAISVVAVSNDDTFNDAVEERLVAGIVWNEAFTEVIRDVERFS